MQRSSRNRNLIGAAGCLCFVLVLIALISPTHRRGAGSFRVSVLVDSNNYATALMAYSNVFGVLPSGNNSNVTATLLGKNPRKQQFLFLSSQSLNEKSEFLDPKHRAYDIEVTTNRIRIALPPN